MASGLAGRRGVRTIMTLNTTHRFGNRYTEMTHSVTIVGKASSVLARPNRLMTKLVPNSENRKEMPFVICSSNER